MTALWPWGLAITLTVTATIWANGHQKRWGWLLGVAAQLFQIGFGAVSGVGTFYFAAIPAVMFAWNWWRHPRRQGPQVIILDRNRVLVEETEAFNAQWAQDALGEPRLFGTYGVWRSAVEREERRRRLP